MAGRIRTVKPEWLDDDIALEDDAVRVTSIALLLVADDHGRGRANPIILGRTIFPETPEKLLDTLARLSRLGFIHRYTVREQEYFRIVNWARHQKVDKPGRPRVPCPCTEFHRAEECPAPIPEKLLDTLANPPETLATDLRSPITDHRPVPVPPVAATSSRRHGGDRHRGDEVRSKSVGWLEDGIGHFGQSSEPTRSLLAQIADARKHGIRESVLRDTARSLSILYGESAPAYAFGLEQILLHGDFQFAGKPARIVNYLKTCMRSYTPNAQRNTRPSRRDPNNLTGDDLRELRLKLESEGR